MSDDPIEVRVDRYLQTHMQYQLGERSETETPPADTLFLQVMATWLLAQRVKQLCERTSDAIPQGKAG